MGLHDSRAVADWFIRRAKLDGRTLTNMQIQKLVYFAHGWSLGLLKEPLIVDRVEAWNFGPVIPELYRSLARWGSGPVTQPIGAKAGRGFGSEENELMEAVYNTYANKTAYQLSALTHLPGTPWEKVFEPNSYGKVIENQYIAEYFSNKVQPENG